MQSAAHLVPVCQGQWSGHSEKREGLELLGLRNPFGTNIIGGQLPYDCKLGFCSSSIGILTSPVYHGASRSRHAERRQKYPNNCVTSPPTPSKPSSLLNRKSNMV